MKGACPGANCQTYLAIRPSIGKVKEDFIGAVFCIVIILAISYLGRTVDTRNETSSIAGVAVLLNDPEVVEKLRQASTVTPVLQIDKILDQDLVISQTQHDGLVGL